MTAPLTRHDTVTVSRILNAKPARVFAAWADPAALGRWYVPGDDTWASRIVTHEFRVGGRKFLTFGPKDGPLFSEDCRYEDIIENGRLCFVMTIARDNVRMTTSMVTVEFSPAGAGTHLKVTDQCCSLDGSDTFADRERGWGETLGKLPTELTRNTSGR